MSKKIIGVGGFASLGVGIPIKVVPKDTTKTENKIKYFTVELLDGVKCFIYRKPTKKDKSLAREIVATNAIENIDVDYDFVLKEILRYEIKNPIYKSDRDLNVGDTIYVPIGQSIGNKALVKEFVDKPDFLVKWEDINNGI